MDRKELRRRIAQRPRNTRFDELTRLLELSGWELNHFRGSHHVFRKQGQHFSIPRHGAIVKAVYVRLVLNFTKEPGDD